jgi:hypothetical protein
MQILDVRSINAVLCIDGPDFIVDDENYEITSVPTFVGENHPLWGTTRTKEQKQHQSKVIINWWQNASDNKKELMKNNLINAIKSQWELLTPEERKTSRKWKTTPKYGENNPNYGKVSANRGKVWITNGQDNKLVNMNEIPEGWWKGRTL